jgi:hypothetical protein
VCGDHVPRTLQMAAGLQKEIFHCAAHGRLAYAPRSVPLAALATGGTHLGLAPAPGQAGTGLELIA